MPQYQKFYISSYQRDPVTLQARLCYHIDHQICFQELIDFQCHLIAVHTDRDHIEQILIHMHIALGLSYYKLYPHTQIIIQTALLDNQQIDFWKMLYQSGLGEYCARNGIDPQQIGQISCEAQNQTHKLATYSNPQHQALVGIGGGKDSIVTAELLKSIGHTFDFVSIGKVYPLHDQVAHICGRPVLHISRTIDPLLFELNQQADTYNGHVPITGMLAWIKILTAYLYGYNQIILSNEKSADEGNRDRHGREVNHQWSKSQAFEIALGEYLHHYVTDQILYFSLLRGMYEIQIVKLFTHRPQYFQTFSSCNNNFKLIDAHKTTSARRCNSCPKCAFVYSMLRPYLDAQQVQDIRGKELYADSELIPLYAQLLGLDGHKPRECVGTNEEMTLSCYLAYTHHPYLHESPVMQWFADKILPHLDSTEIQALETKLFDRDRSPLVPADLQDHITQLINKMA